MHNRTHPDADSSVYTDSVDRPTPGRPTMRTAAVLAVLAHDRGSRRTFPIAAVIAVAVYALLLPAEHTKQVSLANWGQLTGDDVAFSIALGVAMAAVLTVQTLTWRTAAARRRQSRARRCGLPGQRDTGPVLHRGAARGTGSIRYRRGRWREHHARRRAARHPHPAGQPRLVADHDVVEPASPGRRLLRRLHPRPRAPTLATQKPLRRPPPQHHATAPSATEIRSSSPGPHTPRACNLSAQPSPRTKSSKARENLGEVDPAADSSNGIPPPHTPVCHQTRPSFPQTSNAGTYTDITRQQTNTRNTNPSQHGRRTHPYY